MLFAQPGNGRGGDGGGMTEMTIIRIPAAALRRRRIAGAAMAAAGVSESD